VTALNLWLRIMGFNVDILGAKQLAKALNELPLKIERNIMRAALRAGACKSASFHFGYNAFAMIIRSF